jgi:pimeloyl-ACP methyl ester carboxylesterase
VSNDPVSNRPRRTFLGQSVAAVLGLSAVASVLADNKKTLPKADEKPPRPTMTQRDVPIRDLRMRISEQGIGPLVILCHGFPDTAYSWRHQMPALAAAGFHAVAPDQRGFGGTTRPASAEAYNILELVADMVALVHALGETSAVIVGHDWGAVVAWHCALLRPDMFRGVALLSIPYAPRGWGLTPPSVQMKAFAGEQQFYQAYFQQIGVAEVELAADVRRTILGVLYSASGSVPAEQRWRFMFAKDQRFIDTLTVPKKLPPWLSEKELAHQVDAFKQTGFLGGLNWYRNIDRNWERTAFLSGALLQQPLLFIAGESDPINPLMKSAFDKLAQSAPKLRQSVVLPGVGHWLQQEQPERVNGLIIEFLLSL